MSVLRGGGFYGPPLRLVLMAALFVVVAARPGPAQTTVSLQPAEPARWDVAGHVAWLGANEAEIGVEWDEWYTAASWGVTAGRYLTPHVKAELRVARSGEGMIFENVRTTEPGPGGFPSFRTREHHFRTITVGAALAYQFFENQWFHPFVAAGVDVVRERHRIDLPEQFVTGREPTTPAVLQPAQRGTPVVGYGVHPAAAAGFKLYFGERAFVRTDAGAAFASAGAAYLTWSAGVGVDL